MKTLILLRHAKSGWDDHGARDFDRRLNPKGERAARTMGAHMRSIGLRWDHAIASPAARVVETLEQASEGYGRTIEPQWDRRAYLASAVTLLELVHDAPEASETLLLSGHNPGLEDLILMLVPDGDPKRDEVEEKFPTASLAVMTCEGGDWAGIAAGGCVLTSFTRPRDLDAGLGPDYD
jgi:phosphohistidine phosphatase